MRFPFDDTYITFRYAANIAHGFGIVWNPGGAHTEGYTNFLFVLLLVPFSWMGWDLVGVSQAVSVLAVVISAVAIFRIVDCRGQRRWPGLGVDTHVSDTERANAVGPYGIFAVAFFLLDPFTWLNAYSGMETSLFTMWLLLAVCSTRPLGLVKASPDLKVRRYTPFLCATLAALTRPEGAIMGGILLVVGLISMKDDRRTLLRQFRLVFVWPLVLFAAWKLYYFGNLLPNSFYVKVGQVSGATFLPGRGTMRIFYTGVWYLLPFAAMAAWMKRKDRVVQIVVLWCAMLTVFYLFSQLIQNEYQRFTNSIEVMLFVLVGFSLMQIGMKGWIKCVVLGVILALNIFFALGQRGGLGYIQRVDEEQNAYTKEAEVLRTIPDHEHITLAWGDAGRLPYFSGIQSLDLVGLNTNEIAHAHTADEVVRFIVNAKPEMIIIPLVLPRDDTIPNDTCRRILGRGHGLIGSSFPKLAAAALASSYKPIAMMPQSIYDLEILADASSPHYRDIMKTLVLRIGHDVNFLPPAKVIKGF